MERGTDREAAAVRARWTALEARRRRTNRLLAGVLGIGAGLLLVLFSLATRVCLFTPGGVASQCTPILAQPDTLALVIVGVALGAIGTYRLWTVHRS
jgi:hypothetical protein